MCCVRAQPRIYVSVMLCEHLNLYLRKCHYEKAEIALIHIPFSKHIRKLQCCDQVFSSVFINSLCVQRLTFPDLYFSNSCRENWEDRPSYGIRWSTSFYRFRRHQESSSNNFVVFLNISLQPGWRSSNNSHGIHTSVVAVIFHANNPYIWCCRTGLKPP